MDGEQFRKKDAHRPLFRSSIKSMNRKIPLDEVLTELGRTDPTFNEDVRRLLKPRQGPVLQIILMERMSKTTSGFNRENPTSQMLKHGNLTKSHRRRQPVLLRGSAIRDYDLPFRKQPMLWSSTIPTACMNA